MVSGLIGCGVALVILLSATAAHAATVVVAAQPGRLAAAINAAAAGDHLVLATGRHAGPIVVDRALTLEGEPGAVLLRPVKPCPRCPIPNIDPATARIDPQVSDALQAYRANERVGGAVAFGMNAILLEGVDQVLRVGQRVTADWRFE